MSLAARCPACGTTFRVHRVQLAAKGGKVRCGKCAAVFDGISALLESETAGSGEWAPAHSPEGETAAQAPAFLLPEPAPRHRFPWGFAALLALLALLGQTAIHHGSELALVWPGVRPHLAAVCELAGCELRLPRRPELLAIESSDLQSDPGHENAIVLNAVLRNRASFAQEYPALELTLTDERDYAVLRRVLPPQDYLHRPAAERLAQGIAAGAEEVLRVPLENRGPRAVGYRLYLFFP